MSLEPPPPQDIIIFGASGDLAQRKLLPALFELQEDGLLPKKGSIIGVSRSDLGDDGFKELARKAAANGNRKPDKKALNKFLTRLTFVPLDDNGYKNLAKTATQDQRLVYLSVPPTAVPSIVSHLDEAGLVKGTRIVIEKPFGLDLESSRELDETVHEAFDESQVLRIDHFLGKETVQNILVFRFGNAVFERVWNRDAIDHMQITVAESIGIEGRGDFYEGVGALRDMVQNHVFQVLSLLAMEPPVSLESEAIRDEKAKVFAAMRPLNPAETVRGQYRPGKLNGRRVKGYREEKGVAEDSDAETYFAAKVEIDSWRWAGVPFYIRTGKRLPQTATEVSIVFRDVPLFFFRDVGSEGLRPNHLVLRIQPDEGIDFSFVAKQPGPQVAVQQVGMHFAYSQSFMTEPSEAYERLLHDAMDGDHTLFARQDGVEDAWRVVEPALKKPAPLCTYPAGSWGPKEADELLTPRVWHLHSKDR